MNQKKRMLAGLPYKAWMDGLEEERTNNKKKIYEYNHLPPEKWDRQTELLKSILGKTGENVHIEAPFHCDYGYREKMNEVFGGIMGTNSSDDICKKYGINEEDFPFN